MMTEDQRRELLGLSLLAIGLFLALSLVPAGGIGPEGARWFPSGNIMGVLGAAVREWGLLALGPGLYLLPAVPVLGGIAAHGRWAPKRALRWSLLTLSFVVLVPAWAGATAFRAGADLAGARRAAGWLGGTLAYPLVLAVGWLGAFLVLLFLALVACVGIVGWNPARSAAGGTRRLARRVVDAAGAVRDRLVAARETRRLRGASAGPDPAPPPGAAPVADDDEPAPAPRRTRKRPAADAAQELDDDEPPANVPAPPIPLLSERPERDLDSAEEELDRLGEVLVKTLETFRIEGEIAGRTTGPVVTQFEFVPAPGIKVNRIAALDADLALALKAPSVRIVAPIPGKGAVGVEVPNPEPEVVYLREILESRAFRRSRGVLPLALGRDLTGRPYVADLKKMPHLLIAGATGSGKSICINSMVTSLIYKHTPEELRMLMIDPKMVELSMYGDLPHLRHPVVTDPNDAAMVLKWAVLEMERRYELLSQNNARSMEEFNERVHSGQRLRRLDPVGPEDDPDRWLYDEGPLPYVIVIVDELADLMMTVQSEIERPLAQLAQKARAIGIHLIVATQRPSVNVITGLIKANFPCRIGFRVSSKVDSRTILDQNGADALLGNGDMLFLPPGHSDPVRIQGAYVSTDDTERIMDWYRGREAGEDGEDDILEVVRSAEEEELEDIAEAVLEDRDELFRQAAEIVVQHQQGSTSLLQRRLRIGYGRAARIVDQLHHAGIVGPSEGSRPREVLVGMDGLEAILEQEELDG